MISPKGRFLDVVGPKDCVSGAGVVFERIKGCVAAMGKDCELMICGRGKLGCEGGVTPRVLVFRHAVEQTHYEQIGFERT